MAESSSRTSGAPGGPATALLGDKATPEAVARVNVAYGFALACVFTGLLIGFDIAHLRHLVVATQGGWLAVLMLVVFNTIVFAGVQFAIAVMRMADDELLADKATA